MKSRVMGYREVATDLKADVNAIIWDWSIPVAEVEFKTLYNLVHYLDTFLLRCLDRDGNLTNKLWIQKKLMMCVVFLGASKRPELQRVLTKVLHLENLIYNGGTNGKRDENSNSN